MAFFLLRKAFGAAVLEENRHKLLGDRPEYLQIAPKFNRV